MTCGERAVLSHGSAAALWRLVDPLRGPVHVTVPHRQTRCHRGIVVHRTRHDERQPNRRFAIPVTSVERTLIDLAATAAPSRLREAVAAADRLDVLDLEALALLCDRTRRQGLARLRSLLEQHRPLPGTRSELERRFLRLCDGAGLPRPAVNVVVEGLEVDCLWPEAELVVELDGYRAHRGHDSFERDRRRDITLQIAGYLVLRFTHRRLVDEPERVIAEVTAGLRRNVAA